MNNKYDEIERLNRLRHEGALTEEEFQQEKRRLLNSEAQQTQSNRKSFTASEGLEESDHEKNGTYAMLMHLALLIPSFGWIGSIVMWQVKKKESPLVQQHGATIANLLISMFIYIVIFWVISAFFIISSAPEPIEFIIDERPRFIAPPTKLPSNFFFLLIPFLGLGLLFITTLIFLILNVMKAKKGEAARYPFAFKIFDNTMPQSELKTTDHLIL